MSGTIWTDIATSSPVVTLAIGGLVLLLAEVCFRRPWPKALLASLFVVVALASCIQYQERYLAGSLLFQGLFIADAFSFFLFLLILLGTLATILLGLRYLRSEGVEPSGEYYGLLLLASCGAMVFVSARELITLFLGLETMSMALYCLCGAALRSKRSAESAMKYFLLGSFSSAFLLYGIALLYGMTGTMVIPDIAANLATADRLLVLITFVLVVVGLGFKIAAAPFHFWAPDVYEGAPTPITAYMACVIKAAAVAVVVRVLWGVFGQFISDWDSALWYVAVITMTVGNLVALRQRSMKRMLAYSSVAHAGYLCVALLVPGGPFGGGPALLYYLVVYTLMTIGSFGVVMAVSRRDGDQSDDDITVMNGLGARHPFLAGTMALFMLSLAGLPPGLAGLFAKFYIFSAAVHADYVGLVVIAVLNSAVSIAYYLRVIVAMYFVEGDAREEPSVGLLARGVLGVCAVGVVLLGVFPSVVYNPAVTAASAVAISVQSAK